MLAPQAVSRFPLRPASSNDSTAPQSLAVAQRLAKPDKDMRADPYSCFQCMCLGEFLLGCLASLDVEQRSPDSVGGTINLDVSPSGGIASHFLDAHSFPMGAEFSHSSGILECH